MGTENGMLVIAAVRDATRHLKAAAARSQLDRLAALVEHSDDAVIGQTLSGNITSWDPAAEELLGYTTQQIVCRSGDCLIHDDRAEEINSTLAKILAGQQVERYETVRVRKDGSVLPVSITVSPMRDERGRVVGASITACDQTQQRKSIEATQQMAAIVENSDDAIHSTTLDEVITSWNLAAEKTYGYTVREIIGSTSQTSTPQDRTDEIKDILNQIQAGRRVEHYDTLRVRKDGRVFPVSLTISPARDTTGTITGKIAGASVIGRDLAQPVQGHSS